MHEVARRPFYHSRARTNKNTDARREFQQQVRASFYLTYIYCMSVVCLSYNVQGATALHIQIHKLYNYVLFSYL